MIFKTKMGNCINKNKEEDPQGFLDDTNFRHDYQPNSEHGDFCTFKCSKCSIQARSTQSMIISNIKPKCPYK